ncbi:MAG: metallophosphoesterase [Clostridiales bacterium]|nr:metallophosphoesterase [Clostridiales bacterium]
MEWYYYLVIALFAVAVILFLLYSNNKIKVSKYQILSDKISEKGVKIAHISDLHGKCFLKDNSYLINNIKKQSPTHICITGDIIHNYNPRGVSVAKSLIKECVKIAPVLFVCGNHELRYLGYEAFKKSLQSLGATVLDDKAVCLDGVTFYGVSDSNLREENLKKPDKNSFTVLLAHEPQYFKCFCQLGYNLALCGHAHGGQWRIPFTSIGLYAPGQGIFPKYTSGRHSMGATDMIISRGLGNSSFPIRLFNTPELVVIQINKAK